MQPYARVISFARDCNHFVMEGRSLYKQRAQTQSTVRCEPGCLQGIMSSRYSPYNNYYRRRQERQRYNQQQAFLVETFKKKPVMSLLVTCAVCLDTYTTNSDTLIDFLMPTECTHVFCYKCVLNLYSNAMNVPRATVACPMCNIDVTTWKSFFPTPW